MRSSDLGDIKAWLATLDDAAVARIANMEATPVLRVEARREQVRRLRRRQRELRAAMKAAVKEEETQERKRQWQHAKKNH